MRKRIINVMTLFILFVFSFVLFACDNSKETLSPSEEIQERFEVTYYWNEASIILKSVKYEANETLNLDYIPEAEGYQFINWYLDKEYQTLVPNNFVVVNDVYVYAKMNPLVTLNLKYDQETIPQVMALDTVYTLPTYDKKDGYELIGYTYNEMNYDVGQEITITQDDMTFEALFAKIVYASFDLANGTGTTPSIIKSLEGNKILLPTVSDLISDTNFIGWSDGRNTYVPNAEYTMAGNDVTFTAVYEVKKQIILVLDGKVYDTIELTSATQYEYILPDLEDLYDEEGKLKSLFQGWNDGENTYQGNAIYTALSDSVTLTAVFELNTFQVTFRDWDGTILKTEEVAYGQSATVPDLELLKVEEFVQWSQNFDNVTSVTNVRAQYTFSINVNITTLKSYFTYYEDGGHYLVSSVEGVSLPEVFIFPTSANGKLIEGIGKFTSATFKEIYIPATYKELDYRALYNCRLLTKVNFGKNSQLTIVDDNAFENNFELIDIRIPEGVITIGRNVFYNCRSLTSVHFPSTLQEIGSHLFYHAASLSSITVSEDSNYYQSVDGNLYSKDLTTIVYYAIGKKDTSYTVLPTTTKISRCAFQYAENLSELNIGNKIVEIGDYAFANCPNITSMMTIPATLTSLGKGIFYEFRGPVVLEEGIETITSEMFMYYRGTTITIPASVKTIASYAFSNAFMTNLVFNENSSLTTIEEYGFYQCTKLTNVAFEKLTNLETIADKAFYQAGLLGIYTMPASLKTIGASAFEYSNIQGIRIAENSNLSTIGESAFFKCYSLTEFNYPHSLVVSTIGMYAFADNYTLKTVVLPEKLSTIAPYAFGLYNNGTVKNQISGIEIPSSVEYIGNYAFAGSEEMTSLIFKGNQLKSIEDYAFKRCTSLTEVTLPSSLQKVGTGVFQYCSSLKTLTMAESDNFETVNNILYNKIDKIAVAGFVGDDGVLTIKDQTLAIATEAFAYQEEIKVVHLSDSVKVIGNRAFNQCYGLTTLDISENSQLESIGEYAFADSVVNAGIVAKMNIESLYLPSSLKEIKANAFIGNGKITSIHLPASLETIESYVFSDCFGLQSVTSDMNGKLYQLGQFAFQRCKGLTSVEINSSAIEIFKAGAFARCTSLASLKFSSVDVEYGGNCLIETPSTLKIYVPAEAVGSYKTRSGWKDFVEQIYPIESEENELWG